MTKKFLGGKPRTLPDGSTLPFSPAIQCGNFVFLSGQLGYDEDGKLSGDVSVQTRRALTRIQGLLAEAGCALSDVVKSTCWLVEKSDFPAFNKVYAEFFPTNPPTRSTVRADLMVDGKVEIEVLAVRP